MRDRWLSFLVCCLCLAGCLLEPGPGDDDGDDDLGVAEQPLSDAEIEAEFQQRARGVIERLAGTALPDHFGVGFAETAMAKLELAVDPTHPDRTTVSNAVRSLPIPGLVGTDFKDGELFCKRVGDYDMALRGLVTLAYRFGPRGADRLEPLAYERLLGELLNQRGNDRRLFVNYCESSSSIGAVVSVRETENHILMTESSRYLTNQLLRERDPGNPAFDNNANGMKSWLLGHLQHFLVEDFYEYNSRPYAIYTLLAIHNLFELAEDPEVRIAAQLVMDYLAAKFAVSSNRLRRLVPYRRLPGGLGVADLFDQFADEHMHWFSLMVGAPRTFGFIALRDLDGVVVPFALGRYRVPLVARELALDKSTLSYFQRFKHTGVEIYASSPEVLITAGGLPANPPRIGGGVPFPFSLAVDAVNAKLRVDAGLVVPTTIMPTRGSRDVTRLIRFGGHPWDRRETCVAPGFACGVNLMIPDDYRACGTQRGEWLFIDASCPSLAQGFYAAVRGPYNPPTVTVDLDTDLGSLPAWFAMIEVAGSTAMSFDDFQARVLERNGARPFASDAPNTYETVTGRIIRFASAAIVPRSQILSVDDVYFDGVGDIDRWPLARGDIMNGGDGFIHVRHPTLKHELILDFRKVDAPARVEIDGRAWPALGGWIQPSAAPGSASASIAVIQEPVSRRMVLFGIGSDHGLYFKNQSGALDWDGWNWPHAADGSWHDVGWSSRIAAIGRPHGTYVYGIDADRRVRVLRGPWPSWTGWQPIPQAGERAAVDVQVVEGAEGDQAVVILDAEGRAVMQMVDGRLDYPFTLHGSRFSGWLDLGHPDGSPLTQLSLANVDHHLQLVALDAGGRVWRRRQRIEQQVRWWWDPVRWRWLSYTEDVHVWTGWEALSQTQFCDVDECFLNRMVQVVAARTPVGSPGGERLAVIALREDGKVFRSMFEDTDAAPGSTEAPAEPVGPRWTVLPFAIGVTQIAVGNNAEGGVGHGRLEVFGADRGGRVWHVWQSGLADDGWGGPGWRSNDGPLVSLSVAPNIDGRLEVFGVDPTNGIVRHDWQTWEAWGLGWYR